MKKKKNQEFDTVYGNTSREVMIFIEPHRIDEGPIYIYIGQLTYIVHGSRVV